MYKIGDIIVIMNNDIEMIVKIVRINLDETYGVLTANGEVLRIYREDIKE